MARPHPARGRQLNGYPRRQKGWSSTSPPSGRTSPTPHLTLTSPSVPEPCTTRLVVCSRRPICRSSSTSSSLTTLCPASGRPWCLSCQRGLFRMGSTGVAAASLSLAFSVSRDRRGLVQRARRDNQAAPRSRFGPGSNSLYGRSGSSRTLVAAINWELLGPSWYLSILPAAPTRKAIFRNEDTVS
jgi:hypothetical protein